MDRKWYIFRMDRTFSHCREIDVSLQGSSGGSLGARLIRLRIIRIANDPKETANVSMDHGPNVEIPASDTNAIISITHA